MSKKAPGYAARTHDLHAVWPERDRADGASRIGLLLRTDTGKHLHVLFDEDVSILGAVVLAVPTSMTPSAAVERLSRVIEHASPPIADSGDEEIDRR